MRSGTRKEDAVSPVIATILLLIMTVTVITVAALVVTDIAGGYGDAKSVDIRVSPTGTDALRVVVTGGPDAVSLRSLTLSAEKMAFEDGGVVADPQVGLPDVIKYGSSVAGEVLLILVGTFADGTVQMVYQGTVNVQAGGGVPTPNPSVMPTATVTTATPTPTATPQTSVNNSVTAYFRSYVNTTENLPAGQTYVIPGRGIYLRITEVNETLPTEVRVLIEGMGLNVGESTIKSPNINTDYYFYLTPQGTGKDNPYTEIISNPEATADISAVFSFSKGSDSLAKENITVGKREVIFEDKDIASCTVNLSDVKRGDNQKWMINITNITTMLPQKDLMIQSFYNEKVLANKDYMKDYVGNNYPYLTIWNDNNNPTSEDTVEIFLRAKVGSSVSVWYRIATIHGNDIKPPA